MTIRKKRTMLAQTVRSLPITFFSLCSFFETHVVNLWFSCTHTHWDVAIFSYATHGSLSLPLSCGSWTPDIGDAQLAPRDSWAWGQGKKRAATTITSCIFAPPWIGQRMREWCWDSEFATPSWLWLLGIRRHSYIRTGVRLLCVCVCNSHSPTPTHTSPLHSLCIN